MQAYEQSQTAPLEPLLNIGAVAELLGLSRASIYRLIEAGELQPIRVGARSPRVSPAEIRRFVERRRARES